MSFVKRCKIWPLILFYSVIKMLWYNMQYIKCCFHPINFVTLEFMSVHVKVLSSHYCCCYIWPETTNQWKYPKQYCIICCLSLIMAVWCLWIKLIKMVKMKLFYDVAFSKMAYYFCKNIATRELLYPKASAHGKDHIYLANLTTQPITYSTKLMRVIQTLQRWLNTAILKWKYK